MLHYDEYGSINNPTILLLHGAGALDTFGFGDRYHLIVPHLPGAGKAADKIYEPENTTKELFALIDSLHKERIGVIGHSLGGQIAIMLVSRKPERFHFAVFLSAWVNPRPKTIQMYCSASEHFGHTRQNRRIIWRNMQSRSPHRCIDPFSLIH